VKAEYQETPIGKIPKDWEVVKISDLFTVETGTTPSTKQREYWNNGNIDWFTPADFSELNNEIYVRNCKRKITEKGLKETSLTLMPKGSIILSTRAPVGYAAVLKKKGTFNQGCKGLIPKNFNEVSSEFYCYYLLSEKQALQNLSGGSTFIELSKKWLENFNIPLLPLEEQKSIALILSTVDDAIEKADEGIAKTEKLKKGLMQELLTKGIGRKEFKDTEIGNIPNNWEVFRLGDFTKVTVGYVGPISRFYSKSGIPLLSTTNITENGIKLEEIKHVTDEFHLKNKKSKVSVGDLIIARHGMSGTAAVIPNILKEAQCLNVVIVHSSEKFESKFIEYLFNFKSTRGRLLGWKSGSVQGVVNTKVLEKFKLPLPPIEEQQKIVEILSTVDKKLEIQRKRKGKLERIKKGLMNDLLTGKKRVEVS
jgi:type I restriction enzyme S subunit